MCLNLFPKTNRWFFYILLLDIILYLILPLKIHDVESRDIVYPLIWLSFFILGAIFSTQESNPISLTILTIGYFLITCVLAFLFFGFCRWSNYGELYKNKKHDSLSLICKTFDCYGTSEDCKIYKQRKLLENVYWITKFDEKIDTTIWQKAP